MKDNIGQEITVGSTVLYADVDDGAVTMYRALVVDMTPKKVRVSFTHNFWGCRTILTSPTRVVCYVEGCPIQLKDPQ